jgi:hypothetical protein
MCFSFAGDFARLVRRPDAHGPGCPYPCPGFRRLPQVVQSPEQLELAALCDKNFALFALRATPIRALSAPCWVAPPMAVSTAAPVANSGNAARAAQALERPDLGSPIRSLVRDTRFTGILRSRTTSEPAAWKRPLLSGVATAHCHPLFDIMCQWACVFLIMPKGLDSSALSVRRLIPPLTTEEQSPFHEWCAIAFV